MKQRMRRAERATKAQSRRIVRAGTFEIVDGNGVVLARLGRMPGAGFNEPGIGMMISRSDGSSALTIGVDGVGPAIHFTHGGAVRLSVTVIEAARDTPVLLALHDGHGHEVAAVIVTDDGTVSVDLGGGLPAGW